MEPQRKNLFVALVLTAFAGGTLFMYLALQNSNDVPTYATLLPEPLPLPEFSLLDQTGKEFSRESLQGRWSIIFFGFTNCPDICPATLQQLSLARSRVNGGGREKFPQIILVSVDPERDTAETLREYTSHFGADVTGVTGSIDELKKLTSATGIFFEKSAQSGENYSVNHSAVVLLIDRNADFRALFSAPHTVDQFVNDIPLITESS